MPSPRDRPQHILEQDSAYPLPPLNAFCISIMSKEAFDIRWTYPEELHGNSRFNVIGVNVYRSFNSEFGPFFRLNAVPVGSGFWRDRTTIRVAMNEDVTGSFTAMGFATDPMGRYVFRTRHRPMHVLPTPSGVDCIDLNIRVTVNGVQSFVAAMDPGTGQVELLNRPLFDAVTQRIINPVLPSGQSDVVLATYMYYDNQVVTALEARVFYRITTVAVDVDGSLLETPINRAATCNNQSTEKLDYMWAEAIRRNSWMLQQAGERAKVFIRRSAGPRCGCNSTLHKQPLSDCLTCFATGIIGGYDGPFDVYLAPSDSENSIKQGERGRFFENSYDTWTGPSPLLSQRDFLVKLNGDRYGIGPVRMPTSRGMQLQQFFTVSHLDEVDIRYKVPVPDPGLLVYPQTRYMSPDHAAVPMITDSTVPAERHIRGQTPVFENTYGK